MKPSWTLGEDRGNVEGGADSKKNARVWAAKGRENVVRECCTCMGVLQLPLWHLFPRQHSTDLCTPLLRHPGHLLEAPLRQPGLP